TVLNNHAFFHAVRDAPCEAPISSPAGRVDRTSSARDEKTGFAVRGRFFGVGNGDRTGELENMRRGAEQKNLA
ncbi:hypothetical protein DPA09_15765, partial [Salmonella enterica subsp. enterica]|nr:hypothetical protein [Salmonella enterica subsp. enterica serovar Mikawasima]EBR0168436.1 hypothetical protein [Salmonella enterica subsp. enterica serovar Mikawasima]